MKKMMLLLTSLLLLGVSTARADHDRVITLEQLPRQAQTFIGEYFPEAKVAYAKYEREFLDSQYTVVFTDGRKVEFRGNGTWSEVNCHHEAVPEGLIPAAIRSRIDELYSEGIVVHKIERMKRDGYEVELSNGRSLEFDSNLRLIDID